MTQLPRIYLSGITQHITHGGNGKWMCLVSDEDLSTCAHCLDDYSFEYQFAIHGWMCMTANVYLFTTPATGEGVSRKRNLNSNHDQRPNVAENYCSGLICSGMMAVV